MLLFILGGALALSAPLAGGPEVCSGAAGTACPGVSAPLLTKAIFILGSSLMVLSILAFLMSYARKK